MTDDRKVAQGAHEVYTGPIAYSTQDKSIVVTEVIDLLLAKLGLKLIVNKDGEWEVVEADDASL